MDPERLMIAARRAFRAENPEVSESEACAHVGDVYDAVNALIDRYGSIASDHADVAAGATPQRRMHGGSACFRATGFLIGQTDCLRQVR